MLTPQTRRRLVQLLHTHDTPERTAAAYALGVFIGFSPFLGFHTVLGLVLAFALSLNRVAVLLGIYSNLPWILPAYYTLATAAGAEILRIPLKPRVLRELSSALTDGSWKDLSKLAHILAPFAWAYALGSTIGALILGVIAFWVALTMIRAHRRHLAQQQSQHLQ